jgi:hypothetical protein
VKLKSSWHFLFQNVSSAESAAKNLFVDPRLRTSRVCAKGSKLSRKTSTGISAKCIVKSSMKWPKSTTDDKEEIAADT